MNIKFHQKCKFFQVFKQYFVHDGLPNVNLITPKFTHLPWILKHFERMQSSDFQK